MTLLRPRLLVLVTALPCIAFGQVVSASVSKPAGVSGTTLSRGQMLIDITTLTRHPANLVAQNLKPPDGVRVVASNSLPGNSTTCARSARSQSECRQTFRVKLDAGTRCHVGGRYEALFTVACWPGTAASLCQQRAYQFEFNLANEPLCSATPSTAPRNRGTS